MARKNESNPLNKKEAAPVVDYDKALLSASATPDFDARDLAVPRVKLLQALSPECVKGEQGYIKEARPGDIMLPNGKLLQGDEGFIFIPVYYKREGLVFAPNRGGFVANLGTDYDAILASCTNGPNGEKMTPEGNELIETATYFGFAFVEDDDDPLPVVICMNKTQWRSAKKFNGMINQFREKTSDGKVIQPPMYWRSWRFTTDTTKNDKGSWFLYTATPIGKVLDMPYGAKLFELCKQFREEVFSGARTAKHEDASEE